MSRIGRKSIIVPAGVELKIEGHKVTVKGSKGTLHYEFLPSISVQYADNKVVVERSNDEQATRALHGLTRALINNMVTGVSEGFEKKLELIGVGYRAQVAGRKITLNLGFSHPVEYSFPEGISVEMDKDNKNIVIVRGADRQLVGEVASNIRKFRPPEPYKGKGIRYVGEYVPRKAGKSVAGGKE